MKEQNWLEEGWFFHNHAWHLLHEIIKQIPDNAKNMLDYGAGTGIAASIIKAIYPDMDVKVTDISENSIPFWIKRKLDGFLCDSEDLPFPDNYFDFIMSSHVLEHLTTHSDLIKELFRICKKRIVIVVPDGGVNFYDHKTIFDRTVLKNVITKSLQGEKFNYISYPVYHYHINNLIAVIDKVE